MASAIVTIKVTPNELQVISAALEMFAYANKSLVTNSRTHLLKGYHHALGFCENNPCDATRMANAIRHQIGLR